MADVRCPKCDFLVNSRGLAGHLRFKHKVKSGKPLKALIEQAKPHEYPQVVSWMDRAHEVEDRARELKWMYYNKRLGLSLEELRDLLLTMRAEYVRVLTESRAEMSGAITGGKRMLVSDVLKAHPERSELKQFEFDPKAYEEMVKEDSQPINTQDEEEAKSSAIKALFGHKASKLYFQRYESEMRKKHG